MDNVLAGLNPAQLSAVTNEADVLQILAPPGSGKTKTLTSRVAYLLKHHKYRPWNVIVATFTVKAAREMGVRIEKMLGGGAKDKLILGTFHSIARRYLVRYGHLIGIGRNFGIADASDSQAIIKRIVKKKTGMIDANTANSRISNLKARGMTIEQYCASHAGSQVFGRALAEVYHEYEDTLRRSNTLDFNDLLLRCCDLLRAHPECVSNVEAVLIDEFQDTNITQFELMTLMASKRKRISTVGDTDQSIYAFRCAEIKNLQRMCEHYPDSLTVHLDQNYRSAGAILHTALEVIEQDHSRPKKPLSPTHCVGSMPVLRKLPDANAEAVWIVQEIRRVVAQTGGTVSYGDVSILIRMASLSRAIETALSKAMIPYRVHAGLRFYDRAEIKLLLDYLRVISSPHNTESLARIINVPSRRIGEKSVKKILELAEDRKISMWALITQGTDGLGLSTVASRGIQGFVDLITQSRNKLQVDEPGQRPLADLVNVVITKIDLKGYLKKTYGEEEETRWANVEEFLAQASELQTAAGSAEVDALPEVEGVQQDRKTKAEELLDQLLSTAALTPDPKSSETEEEEQASKNNSVVISTIHAAKGLEWPVVFVPAVYNGSLPHSRAENHDEERRLLYVAMTRAQALLYMTIPKVDTFQQSTELSLFLDHKGVSKTLANKGPTFDSETRDDVCSILGRPRASMEDIERLSADLESVEDDIWPLKGQHQSYSRSADIFDVAFKKPAQEFVSGKEMLGKNLAPASAKSDTKGVVTRGKGRQRAGKTYWNPIPIDEESKSANSVVPSQPAPLTTTPQQPISQTAIPQQQQWQTPTTTYPAQQTYAPTYQMQTPQYPTPQPQPFYSTYPPRTSHYCLSGATPVPIGYQQPANWTQPFGPSAPLAPVDPNVARVGTRTPNTKAQSTAGGVDTGTRSAFVFPPGPTAAETQTAVYPPGYIPPGLKEHQIRGEPVYKKARVDGVRGGSGSEGSGSGSEGYAVGNGHERAKRTLGMRRSVDGWKARAAK